MNCRQEVVFCIDIAKTVFIAHVFDGLYILLKNREKRMAGSVKMFRKEREKLNEILLSRENLNIKRFFGIDDAVYRDGALDAKTKELLGLVASLVLRCDDCITYHTIKAGDLDVTDEEFDEVLAIGMVVGGSITIPHIRRASGLWDEMKKGS